MGQIDREHQYEAGLRARHTCTVGAAIGAAVSLGTAAIGANASKKASNAASSANDAQAQIARQQAAIAQEQWDTYKELYQPLEKNMVAGAMNYDTPERREAEAAAAGADVNASFGRQTGSVARQLASYGVNADPSGGQFGSTLRILAGQGAAAEAGAKNVARRNVQDTAWARQVQMASVGRGLPAVSAANMNGAANTFGNSAAMNYGVANNQAYNTGQVIGAITQPLAKVDWGNIIGGSNAVTAPVWNGTGIATIGG